MEQKGKLQEAISDYSKAIQLNWTDSRPYKYRGVVHFNLGNFSAALEDFTGAIHWSPDEYDYYHWRSRSYLELGEYYRARHDAVESDNKGNEISREYYELINKLQYGVE